MVGSPNSPYDNAPIYFYENTPTIFVDYEVVSITKSFDIGLSTSKPQMSIKKMTFSGMEIL